MLFLRIILYPFTFIYGFLVAVRNFLFDSNIFRSVSVQARVISVGNITVGGSGKTPAVNMLAGLIKKAGRSCAVISRGYGRKSSGYLLVSDGKNIFTSAAQSGDEIYMTALESCVPAAVAEKRVEGAQRLLKDIHADTLLLDDAFQHRWIKRDVDILLFDQSFLLSHRAFSHSLLPSGFLREPFSSIERADVIIINRKFSEKAEPPQYFCRHAGSKKIFTAYYRDNNLYDVRNHSSYSLREFKGQKSLVVSGVADPASFLNVLSKHDVNTDNHLIFRDHKHYTNKEVQSIRKMFYTTNSHSVITTQKDAVKLVEYRKELDDIDIYYLKIEMVLDEENEFYDFLLSKI